MGASEFYLSKKLVKGFGKMRFLINLQEANAPGGGRSLLGSVVKELQSGGFLGIGAEHYPAPHHLTAPRLIVDAIDQRRQALGLAGQALILPKPLAAAAQVIRIEKKHSYQVGIGKFPSLPLNLHLGVDYDRMKSIEISFGEGTRAEYIPLDYLARLYRDLDGDAKKIDPAVAIDIDDNYIVSRILLASNFNVIFESTGSFSADFAAGLSQINALPEAQGKVQLTQTSENRTEAKISGGSEYLVALSTVDWDDLD